MLARAALSSRHQSYRHLAPNRWVVASTPLVRHSFAREKPSPTSMQQTYNTLNGLTANAATSDPRLRLSIPPYEEDPAFRSKYRPFLQHDTVSESDWVARLELDVVGGMVAADLAATGGERIKVLVLFGSMRARWVAR